MLNWNRINSLSFNSQYSDKNSGISVECYIFETSEGLFHWFIDCKNKTSSIGEGVNSTLEDAKKEIEKKIEKEKHYVKPKIIRVLTGP